MKVDPSARIPANTVELPMGNPLFPSTVGEGGEGVCSGVSYETFWHALAHEPVWRFAFFNLCVVRLCAART